MYTFQLLEGQEGNKTPSSGQLGVGLLTRCSTKMQFYAQSLLGYVYNADMNITKRQMISLLLFLVSILGVFYLVHLNESANDSRRSYFEYIVQEGDTCLDIAYNLGVSIESIVEANDLIFDCSDIYPGQKLSIPYPTPTPFGFVEATYVVIDCEKVFYTVQEGDSVPSIANDYYIPKPAIRYFNGIEGDISTPGMEIVIPLCVQTPRYIDPTPTATLALP